MKENEQTVFIVDDDEAVRESLSVLLETAGYSTEVNTSVQEFLSKLEGCGNACVLLDTLMPGQNGLDALKELRVVCPTLPVIMIAGSDGAVSADDAIRAGAMDYLNKPFLEEALYDRIERAFNWAQKADGRSPSAEEAGHARCLVNRMTAREREIFEMLVIGKSCAMIALQLRLDQVDVMNHLDAILEKLKARTIEQLMRIALLCDIPIRGERATD